MFTPFGHCVFSFANMANSNGDSASSAPSTPNGSEDSPRKCIRCNRRISALRLDAHADCIPCRGIDCNVESRCPTCSSWSLEVMHAYLKHRKILASKRDYKRRKSARASQDRRTPSVGASTASVSDSNPPTPHDPVGEPSMAALHSMMANMAAQFTSFQVKLHDLQVQHDDLKVKQDATNPSFSAGSSTLPDSAACNVVAGGLGDPSASRTQRDPVQASGEVAGTPTSDISHSSFKVSDSSQPKDQVSLVTESQDVVQDVGLGTGNLPLDSSPLVIGQSSLDSAQTTVLVKDIGTGIQYVTVLDQSSVISDTQFNVDPEFLAACGTEMESSQPPVTSPLSALFSSTPPSCSASLPPSSSLPLSSVTTTLTASSSLPVSTSSSSSSALPSSHPDSIASRLGLSPKYCSI